jgi:phosphoglycolate phosphatase
MIDTLGDFAEALNRMLRELGLPRHCGAQHIETHGGQGLRTFAAFGAKTGC